MKKAILTIVVIAHAASANGQCRCNNSPSSAAFKSTYDYSTYFDAFDSVPFCFDEVYCVPLVGRLIKCEDHVLATEAGSGNCVSSPSPSACDYTTVKPTQYTAKEFHIRLHANSPLMKTDFRLKGQGRALFDPLYDAVKTAGAEVERFCMEKGHPVVYSTDNTTGDQFNAEAYFDGTSDDQITVRLVLIAHSPSASKQALADTMNHGIATRLADLINGTLEEKN